MSQFAPEPLVVLDREQTLAVIQAGDPNLESILPIGANMAAKWKVKSTWLCAEIDAYEQALPCSN